MQRHSSQVVGSESHRAALVASSDGNVEGGDLRDVGQDGDVIHCGAVRVVGNRIEVAIYIQASEIRSDLSAPCMV